MVSACGSSGRSTTAAATAATATSQDAAGALPASGACAARVAGTLGGVGERVYNEASSGGDVEQAVHRVQSSTALASAIESGNTSAAAAALDGLLVNQIVRIEVLRAGQVFAAAGSGAAIAPVHGSIPGTDASFILSVQADQAYAKVAEQVTGARILLLGGARRLGGSSTGASPNIPSSGSVSFAGNRYEVYSLSGQRFPSGRLRIALLVPSAAISCPGSLGQAQVEALGHVGERIYAEELHSAYVLSTLHHMERDPGFQRAVADRDVAATRSAIVGFFAAHIHVVRVRVTVPDSGGSQRLLIDLGGPYVLAPVHGTLSSGGKLVGQFSMAIQDDAGYLKLAHLFTGADVLMRNGSHQVMGTLNPGPANVPARGEVSYGKGTYQAYSFLGESFPSGPLRISLLIGYT
jgi:hypothetical protein